MILKRIVPVISVLMILFCMLAVPASAASVGDGSSVPGRVPFAGLEVLLSYIDNDGSLLVSSFSQTDRLLNVDEDWIMSGSGTSSPGLYWSASFSDPTLSNELAPFDCDGIWRASFLFDDFFVKLSSLSNTDLFNVLVPAGCTLTFSYTVTGAGADGCPTSYSVNVEVADEETDYYFSPFRGGAITSEALLKGIVSPTVLISDLSVVVVYDRCVSVVTYDLCYQSFEPLASADEFLTDNHFDFGGNVIVEGDGLFQGFSDFLVNGVGAFFDADLFGGFSLGYFIFPVIAVAFVLALLRMFS